MTENNFIQDRRKALLNLKYYLIMIERKARLEDKCLKEKNKFKLKLDIIRIESCCWIESVEERYRELLND